MIEIDYIIGNNEKDNTIANLKEEIEFKNKKN